MARKQFKGGPWRPPVVVADLVARLTCRQFVGLFWEPAGSHGQGSFDRLEQLTGLNRDRGRKGLKPIFPSWLVDA